MRRARLLPLAFTLVAALASFRAVATPAEAPDLARHVNPFVGTDGHGHTFPGATVPFGLVQASPDTRVLGWDACAGYHYSDTFIYGVSHTHLSGVGIPDYCDILVAPQAGEPTITTPRPEAGTRGYGARFLHERERAEPGYYAVHLDDPGIDVELTATARVALHRYTFPAAAQERSLVLDLEHRDLVLDAALQIVSPTEIAGLRRSAAWAKDQLIHFVLRFEDPVASVQLFADGQPVAENTRDLTGKKLKALIRFAPPVSETSAAESAARPLQFKVALSPVSIDGARRNLAAELPGWDFAATRSAARTAWNRVLGKVVVEGRDAAQLRTFYTALYHTYLAPNLFNDADGAYRGRDGEVHHAPHGTYTIFSLWDTYRAWHPLMTLLEPAATQDFIRTFLLQFQQGGLLPVWDLAGNETFCMNGYHAVSVIADAYAKGLRDWDASLALTAMQHSATRDHFGLGAYQQHGFIGREDGREGVARTLEYAYDDWCIAQLAGALGRYDVQAIYRARAQSYRHLFHPQEHFFVGRENGGWYAPFNPREINFNYTEGNAWHYRFAVPHDIPGLITLFGGDAPFGAALDALFAAPAVTEGRNQADVTGLIGQYAHGNEPSHHVAYLPAFVGRPSATQRRVREILATQYSDQPDGICGNDDCGQMSAWFVLSALGFYPVTPGSTQYVLGAPLFDRATINLGDGRRFTITARNQSPENCYIAAIALNGTPLTRSWLDHADIVAGGELTVTMSTTPDLAWATAPESRPGARASEADDDAGVIAAPAVSVPLSFRTEALVTMTAGAPGDSLWFTLDGSTPVPGRGHTQRYMAPFTLHTTTRLAVLAERAGRVSPVVHAETHHADTGLHVTIATPINPQYLAGGPGALVDGVKGGPDFTTGRWQGYEGADLSVTVDLGHRAPVRRIEVGFLQEANSYIFYPPAVHFTVSDDGVIFRELETVRPPETPRDTTKTTITRVATRVPVTARYVRIHAPNPGDALAWGSADEWIKSFLFCDEIEIDRD